MSLELKMKVAQGMKRLYERDLVSSLGGNLSARTDDGRVFITPSGSPKWELTEEDIVEVDLNGSVLSGKLKPSSELPSHLMIYRERTDVFAVAHAHPPHAVALATAGFLKEPPHVTPEEVLYLRRLSVLEFAPPGIKTAQAISSAVHSSDVIVVKNHGAFSMGKSIEEAIARIEILEEASKIIFMQLLLGRLPMRIPDNLVEEILETYKKT
ncbi:MAG: class II aldolase/adducin family protein [Fervidicoccaceae archaeon]